eukprot:XP_002261495.1 hypothetical protein, conserved in Plasmodium species [Plasmodium knowlesi strain H]
MRVPLPLGPASLFLRRRWANRITAVRIFAAPNFHLYGKRNITSAQNQQRTNRSEEELEKTIKLVDKILKENNFDVYIKGIVNTGGVPKAASKEVDAYKFLHLLNRILVLSREVDESSDGKTNIWECPTFLNLLGYIKLKIPSFSIHEMFIFVLCFSKIQFMPQMLMHDFLLTVQEKSYLKGFLEADVNKFFQFFFIVTSIKNVRVGDQTDSLFASFATNFVEVVLDFLAVRDATSPGESVHLPTDQQSDIPPDQQSDVPTDLRNDLPLDCYHLLCVALHNANVRNASLMHRVATEILHLLSTHQDLDKYNQIDLAKKLINIYLAYVSLKCENYYLYEKLNTYLYNHIEELPLPSSLTLLLCIATLKEQKCFNFPLCMLSSLEKNFSGKFYSLDAGDLLLLVYLLTYLNLHIANTETYVCMLDHLFNVHKFEPLHEDERIKLFQIYVSLVQSFPNAMSCELHSEITSHTNGANRKCDSEGEEHDSDQPTCRTKLQNVLRKIQANMQVQNEQNPPEYAEELNEQVDNLHEMLQQISGNTFSITNFRKNTVVLSYYLSHISFDLKKEGIPEAESQKIVILFDTDKTHLSDNSFDIYCNMKRNHLAMLNIKCFPIKLHQWRELSPEERRQFLTFELTHRFLPSIFK